MTKFKTVLEAAEYYLDIDPIVNEQFSFIVHHPLLLDKDYYFDQSTGELKSMYDSEGLPTKEFYEYKDMCLDMLRSKLSDSTNPGDLLYLISSPYRLQVYSDLLHLFDSDEDAAEYLVSCYSLDEFPMYNASLGGINIKELFLRNSNHRYGYDKDSIEEFNNLPENITIYRAQLEDSVVGVSWTLDKDVTDIFTNRQLSRGTSVLLEKTINKYEAKFYIGGLESEVIYW